VGLGCVREGDQPWFMEIGGTVSGILRLRAAKKLETRGVQLEKVLTHHRWNSMVSCQTSNMKQLIRGGNERRHKMKTEKVRALSL